MHSSGASRREGGRLSEIGVGRGKPGALPVKPHPDPKGELRAPRAGEGEANPVFHAVASEMSKLASQPIPTISCINIRRVPLVLGRRCPILYPANAAFDRHI